MPDPEVARRRGRTSTPPSGPPLPVQGGDTLRVLRLLLLGVLAVGCVGLLAELALLEHWEEPRQWIPLLGLLATLIMSALVWRRPTPRLLRSFQLLMFGLLAAGILGMIFHLQGNAQLEQEIDPGIQGFALLGEAFLGGTPALAPGAMIQLGLLGLLVTFRHPASRR